MNEKTQRGGKQYVCLNEGGVREPTGRVHACSAVPLFLHLYCTLTANMEDSIAKLKHCSKMDFQLKREVINNGRPMPVFPLAGARTTRLIGKESSSPKQKQGKILYY